MLTQGLKGLNPFSMVASYFKNLLPHENNSKYSLISIFTIIMHSDQGSLFADRVVLIKKTDEKLLMLFFFIQFF